MDRCPACRGRLDDTALCSRCGCDYTHAYRAETQAHRLTCRAIQAWAMGDARQAATHINAALALKHGHLTRAVAVLLREPT